MLHLFGGTVHFFSLVAELFCEVEFPKAMDADDRGRFLQSVSGELITAIHPPLSLEAPQGNPNEQGSILRKKSLFPHPFQNIFLHAAEPENPYSREPK